LNPSDELDPAFPTPSTLHNLLPELRCPACRGELDAGTDHLACRRCRTRFPIHQGIPLLALPGTVETWEEGSPTPPEDLTALLARRPERRGGRLTDAGASTSEDYQTWYQDLEEARAYNEDYRARPTKRWSTRREFALLGRLLSGRPRSRVLLDLPSGGGRLSPAIAPYTDLLVEADIGFGQLLYAREQYGEGDDRLWLTASAFHIPMRDGAVDGIVCSRLSHHLPTEEERERLVTELLRVSRGFVIMTFFDFRSWKNTVRRIRRPLDGKPPKMTMTVDRVRELADGQGFELTACPPLSRLFSGHRYALMVRR
jgi:uncharacterized protein YbaR (Trm112 family)